MIPPAAPAPAQSPCQPAPVSRAATLLHLLLIGSLVVLVFGQTGGFGFLEWDDNSYVRDNPRVLAGLSAESFSWALTSFDMANWHPLTWWSYQLDISLFGPDPGAMHLENALFHAVNSALVYALFVRLGIGPLPALLSAAVFAIHPLHVESVAWISQRKDVLSTFFLLALLLVWDRYVRGGRAVDYGLALLLAALGLMAKPMLVTLPCLLLVLDAWPYARLRSATQPWFRDRRLLVRGLEKIPFFVLAAACAGLTTIAQVAGGAVRPLDAVSLADRLGNAVTAYAAYLATTVAPLGQSFIYVFAPPAPVLVGVSFAALGLISWWAAKRRGAALAGWLWFLISLLPVIGLIKVGDHARADRYMYLPMIGLLLMLAGTAPFARHIGRLGSTGRRALLAAAGAVVLLLAFAAHRYTGYWRDSEILFQQALRVDPANHVAHTLLAATYEHRRQPQQALVHAERALELAPQSLAAATAAVSASNAAFALGDPALARTYLERAVAAAPKFAKPHYNLGILTLRAGDPAAATTHFQRALALNGRYSEAHNNLGVAFLQLGQPAAARAAFSEAVRNDPGNAQARKNLARTQGIQRP